MLLIGILLAVTDLIQAQTVAVSSVVSAGGSAQNSQVNFSFSLGQVFASDGTRLGKILTPEHASNVCFGGLKKNRLFITATTSLYAVYVAVNGI